MNGQERVTSGIPERAILAACLAFAVGCGGERGIGPESVDSVRLQLDFGGGVTLTSINYDLTGPNSFPERMGTIAVGSTDTITGNFGTPVLPAGMGYDVKVQGLASDGVSTCTGEVVFNMPSTDGPPDPTRVLRSRERLGDHRRVSDDRQPLGLPLRGLRRLLDAARARRGTTPTTARRELTATWTAASGTLTSTSTTGATFTCTAGGPVVVSVSIDDGTPGMQCTDSASVNVICTPLPGGM